MLKFTLFDFFLAAVTIIFMKTTLFVLLLTLTLACTDSSSGGGSSPSESQDSSIVTTPAPSPPPTPTPSPVPPSPSKDIWTEEFMDLVNNHRTSIGLRALILNEEVSEIVRIHSENMAKGVVSFGHTGFSTRCSSARSVLGGGNWCGENVAKGQKTPQAAFTAWMNSSGHRANIESSRATHTGFGYAKSSSGTYYWTQIFIEH